MNDVSAQGRPKREQATERVSAEGCPPSGDPLAIAHTESSLGWGGQEIRTLTEAAGFIGRGHRVTLYAAPGSRIAVEAPRFGVPVTVLPIGRKRPAGVRSLVAALRRHPVDVVNAHSSTDAWLAALACGWLARTRRAAPVLVRTRHVSIPVPRDYATRWLYRTATARVVTTGAALREQLIRDNGLDAARVDSVPTGIDTATFAPLSRAAARRELGLPDAAPLAGIVATLRSWKGHRYLVDAMPRLRRRDARLVIIGDGPQRAALEAQVGQLGLGERHLLVALALCDPLLGAPAGRLGARLVDLVGALGRVGQDGDAIRQHFHEAARNRERRAGSIFEDRQLSDIQNSQQWRVARQNTHLAILGRHIDLIHIVGKHHPLGGDDF